MQRWLMAGLLAVGAAGAQDVTGRPTVVAGDVLLIDKVERSQGVTVPRQGTPMVQVAERFGEPVSRTSPVGEPPITRWRYEDFTVYFEYDKVLHAVVHRETLGLERPS